MSDNIGGISLDDLMAIAMGGLDDESENIPDSTDTVAPKNKVLESDCTTISEETPTENTVNTYTESVSIPSTCCNETVPSAVPDTPDLKAVVTSTENNPLPREANIPSVTTEPIAEHVEAPASSDAPETTDSSCEIDISTFKDNVYALGLLAKSYVDLRDEINPENNFWFEAAVKSMSRELFPNGITNECDAPIKCSVGVEVELLNLLTYGQYNDYLSNPTGGYFPGIFKSMGLNSNKNVLECPIIFNDKKAFSVSITTDIVSRGAAERFVQYLMYSLAANAKKGDVQFRCADKERGGQTFGKFISLIGSNKLFGKCVYSNDSSIADMVSELNNIAEKNIADLKGEFSSVYDYNAVNTRRIPVTLAVFCDISGFSFAKSNEDLIKITNNAQSCGISTIFLTDEGKEGAFNALENQLHIRFRNNQVYLADSAFDLPLDISGATFSENNFIELEDRLNTVEKVNTDFKAHCNIDNMELFTRDATKGLQIPFAFDENNNFVDLEIGDATPHALLSGSTGSGKSVTLHAIINQAMIHYHPDDVEIWAIDYKAVEFGYYVNKRSPHITVIGQDNSEDFTFGLIDMIKAEYDRRKNLFVETNCKDFKAYRKQFGNRSIPRMLIVIDEFHNMTQAISGYSGDKDYKKILENLLSEMRAMGMSFLFCSQTIAAGLNGLTEKGRNQIGCRLSMKHQDITEIKETLSLSATSGVDFESIKYLRQGELIYKKISNAAGTDPYSLERVHVLFTEPYRDAIIDKINANIEEGYVKRDETICKNSNRYDVLEKPRHPISKFIENGVSKEYELLTVFPGAPTSLSDSFSFELNEDAGNNLLLVGENDSMRESIVMSSVLSILMDPQNTVIASILDSDDTDNQRLYNHLSKIKSDRLQINYGYDKVMFCIEGLKKFKPVKNGRVIYLWYGMQKLKNLIFLNSQDEDEEETPSSKIDIFSDKIPEITDPIAELKNTLLMLGSGGSNKPEDKKFGDSLDYSDCQAIMQKLEEYGPENNRYCFMVFNTLKGVTKSKIAKIENYEYRIGLKMSTDDSYDLFGSTSFISKANDSTAVFYSGSKLARTLRPYLMPDEEFMKKYNKALEE